MSNDVFIGRRRSGKTTLAFDKAMQRYGGIMIFDPKMEWKGWPGTVTDVAQIPEKIKENIDIIVFHPGRELSDIQEKFDPFIECVWEMHNAAMDKGWDKVGYRFTVIIDEGSNLSGANWANEKLKALLAMNRPEIMDVYITFQSAQTVNYNLKTNTQDWYIFNTSLPGDLNYLHKEIGVPKEDLKSISELRRHEFAHFTFDGGAPRVAYNYEPDAWFRPLEYFELNAEEREDEMSRRRRDEGELQDLFEDFLDFLDDKDDDRGRRRNRRDDRDDRDDRGRSRSFSLTGRRDRD